MVVVSREERRWPKEKNRKSEKKDVQGQWQERGGKPMMQLAKQVTN